MKVTHVKQQCNNHFSPVLVLCILYIFPLSFLVCFLILYHFISEGVQAFQVNFCTGVFFNDLQKSLKGLFTVIFTFP